MNVLLFGATGMVGQGVLRECLEDPGVQNVTIIVRAATGLDHPKLREIVHPDFAGYSGIEQQLDRPDACFFCLGVSSAGMSEAEYERITYGFTLAAAETLARLNPAMTFIYVSGAGTDSTERGRLNWARVKGRTENALLRLFRNAYMFRPGIIQPIGGIKARNRATRMVYAIGAPLLPILRALFPAHIVTTAEIGRAMLICARSGAPRQILDPRDIRALVSTPRGS